MLLIDRVRLHHLMKKGFHLGQSEFDALLDMLSDDREEAGEVYERIRSGLLRFFRYHGCTDVPDLVDETFNRVAPRTHKFNPSLNHKPEQFFYGFAALIAKEHKRKMARQVPLDGHEPEAGSGLDDSFFKESEVDCLQSCMERLNADDRELIAEYHSLDGYARIELRQRMCKRLKCTSTALYARVSRIRARLNGCIENCMENKM
jgi:DNA-directed RNA polymerase specialized sigma24 family protein